MSELNAGRFPLCAGDFDEAVRDAMTCNNDQRWYKYFVAHDAALRARVAELEGRYVHQDLLFDVQDKLAAMTTERDAYRAVLQGAEYEQVDQIGTLPVEVARRIGEAAAQRTKEIVAERDELAKWRDIIIGTGTDQEAVIRLAATEYTKTAIQCWKDENKKLEAKLAAQTLTWTTARPTVAGWYWFRNQDLKVWPDLGPVIVPVVLLPTTNELTILWASTNQPVCEYNGADEWAGPIPMPKEA